MTDICVGCGEVDSETGEGKYVEFEPVDGGSLYVQEWVCDQCHVDYYIQ